MDNIKINKVSWDLFNDKMTNLAREQFPDQFDDETELNVFNDYTGFVKLRDGRECFISKECTLSIVTDGRINLDLHKVKDKSIEMFPVFSIDVPLDEICGAIQPEEFNLEEFMGNRFGYNSRVKQNADNFIKSHNGEFKEY